MPRQLSVGLSLYALYWVLFVVQPQVYRVSFLLVALVLTFLLFAGSARRESTRVSAARLAARRPRHRRAGVAARRFRALRLPRRRSAARRPRARRHDHPPRARGDAAQRRLDPAGRRRWRSSSTRWLGPLFDRIGLPLLAHRGYPPRSADRHALHDARGHVRRAARRRRDLHHPVHDLRRRARALGRGHVLHRLGDGGDGEVAVGRRRPGARSRSPASCSAPSRAAASRRR